VNAENPKKNEFSNYPIGRGYYQFRPKIDDNP
jgi:hypothetical protein